MTLKKVKAEFKKHYRYASNLKEGGDAWEREMAICEKLLKKGKELYKEQVRAKYGY